MKVRKRQVPMDMLSVEQGNRNICLSTHRHTISLAAYTDKKQVAWHEFTFDQLFALLEKLRPGIQNDVCP